jgi:hypothetical protein
VDVGLHHRAVDAELAPAGDFQRTSQLNGTVVKRCDSLGADRIGPADEGGVLGRSLQIEPPELPQDDGIVHESLGLRVAPSIKPLDYEHPQDHLHRRGMPSNSAGVGMASQQIGLHEVEQLVVIEQFVEAGEFGLEFELEFGDHLEEVHGVVSIDYHVCSAPVEVFGHRNPTGAAYFAPQTI